ncbi:GNAT family N-acetyltransferase, partial [bacterium]|nr:GNAT family N-acetyltransferase [bacterium]
MSKKEFYIRDYKGDDAESLMQMWRESAHLWPMGSPHPTELSGTEFNKRMAGTGAFKDWVAVDIPSNRIVGYCAFSQDTVIPEHMEVSLVNTHPDWQGSGIGKALIIKCIEETAAMGSPALFLGTWPGNEQACGLYKRLGFFHKPDTDIGFVNFIPSVLQCSLLDEQIDKSNWYSSLKRDTSYGPDDHRDGEMKVFPYLFKTDSGPIEVGFERYSNGLYRVKTTDFQMSLKVDYNKGWKGFLREFKVHIKSTKAFDSGFHADFIGLHGLEFSKSIEIAPDKQVFKKIFSIKIPENLLLEQSENPNLQAMLYRNNCKPVELRCGFKPVEPVAASILGYKAFVPVGAGAKRILNIKNNLDEKITAGFTLKCRGNRSVSPDHFELTIESGRTKGIELIIDGEPGSCKLKCTGEIIEGKEGLLPDQD